MNRFDCKTLADSILDQVAAIPHKDKSLLILYAGDDPASASYMKGKIKDCERCGIPYHHVKCHAEKAMEALIADCNEAEDIGGIIVQLPLPDGWDAEKLTQMVAPEKDVDGFRPDSRFSPCTPEGIIRIMKESYGEDLSGSEVLLIGKGRLVGKPLIDMLLDEGCTLTVAHSKTKNLDMLLDEYHDFTICGAGVENLVDLMNIGHGLVIDASIMRGSDRKLCGDCFNFTEDCGDSIFVTPVPGGVGLMTRAILMEHMGMVQYD